ncbi:DUF4336 domain-containing protein [Chamaesiphon sp. VAR_69_metabat_338]|uniref:DUF4336 domain-containing protein n=1 Tax=Chamaesiphon sp. VAR_69_metabat_338 TaxID=2964704 RepID=UPI0037C1A4BA
MAGGFRVTLHERVSTSTTATGSADRSWRFWWTLPIYPYSQRRTIRREIEPDTIWTFEQVQGIFYVVVPIRMTVVKLAGGGLLVYAPVAPTGECLALVNELVALHGDVKYIILPTISGLEHKVFVGPFARQFPQAQVWITPDQWSFPVNLPLSWLGFPRDRTQILPADSSQTPFGDEFDYAILDTIDLGPGQFAEVAFFHRRSRTLLVTDTIVSLPVTPPTILELEPYPLLFHARDRASDPIVDTPAQRLTGWQRICLFSLYFQPSVLEIRNWGQTLRDALTAPERGKSDYFGIYPFDWQNGWHQKFVELQGNGRLVVAPILQTLILNRAPEQTLAWADRVAQWHFERIIPCHFEAPIATTPQAFRSAFSFLEDQPTPLKSPAADTQLLRQIDRQLVRWRIINAAKYKT